MVGGSVVLTLVATLVLLQTQADVVSCGRVQYNYAPWGRPPPRHRHRTTTAPSSSTSPPLPLANSCYRIFPRADWPNCEELSTHTALHWKVDNGTGGVITFALDVDIQVGWLGLGVGEARMLGADITVVHAPKADLENFTIEDRFATAFAQPSLDAQQDVKLLTASKDSRGTRAVWTRPLRSCDTRDVEILYNTPQSVIHAFGNEWGYHGTQNRWFESLKLWPAPTAAPAAAGDEKPDYSNWTEYNLLMPNITIPTNKTSYLCVNFEVPADKKYHIMGFRSVITSAKAHHFVGFKCAAKPSRPVGEVYSCLTQEDMEDCMQTYVFAGKGMPDFIFPPEAGLPIGKDYVQYMMLQVHYSNIEGDEGERDSTGVVFWYSDKLKPYDMGVMMTGGMDFGPIPPGQPHFTITPYVCPSACTARFPGPVTILTNALHMHEAGKSMITRHIRNGIELQPLAMSNYYDFHMGAPVDSRYESRVLLPGDSLHTYCTYDTTGRNFSTVGGAASWDEMCYNSMFYWPAYPEIELCASLKEMGFGFAACFRVQEAFMGIHSILDAGKFLRAGKLVAVPRSEFNYTRLDDKCLFVAAVNGSVVGGGGYASEAGPA